MNADERSRAELDEIRRRFVTRVNEDARTLIMHCEAMAAMDASTRREPLESIRALLHRLAGTAGTLGYGALGARARELEAQAASMLRAGDSPEADGAGGLLAGIAELSAAIELRQPPATQPGSGPTDLASPLIAVVVEDRRFGSRLCKVLEGFGYRVAPFNDLSELHREMERLAPAAIVLRLDNADAQLLQLRTLRDARAEPPPVVIIAASAGFSDYLRAVRSGADGYFTEPPDLPRMESRLHYLIERRRQDGLRVMLVDDDADLLSACGRILQAANMEVCLVDNPSRALAALTRFRPELILMDIRMPECLGPELAQIIRMNEEWLHVPIVYMSTESEGEDQLQAMRQAGEAFLSKPIDANELLATVAAHGRRARQMVETASRDTLTGLLKHSFIKEHLASELERARRSGNTTSAVMIDIDNFKLVNDQQGHLVGDVVIRALANLLRQRLRVIDGIGRIGGEEFLAVLANCGTVEALEIIDGIRERFRQIEFPGKDGSFHVSFSAGVVEAGGEPVPVAELLAAADEALYLAKDLGRDRVISAPAR